MPKDSSAPTATPLTDDLSPAGKGRATPTRKQQEAANKRPLVSGDKKEQRAKLAADREKARIGMANGEEKYLPMRDRGPQKRFARDWVDARFSAGELLIPIMVVVLALSFLDNSTIQAALLLGLWGFFIIVLIDTVAAGFSVRRKLIAKYGKDKTEKVRWYVFMRAIQLRIMRLPKPQVKRWQFPTA